MLGGGVLYINDYTNKMVHLGALVYSCLFAKVIIVTSSMVQSQCGSNLKMNISYNLDSWQECLGVGILVEDGGVQHLSLTLV